MYHLEVSEKYSNVLLDISMNLGLSLDLDEMLEKALSVLYQKLELAGVNVLFFSDSIERGLVYRSVYSMPPKLHDKHFFIDALKSVGSLHRDSDPELLRQVLPSTGFIYAEGEKRFYHIFLLPYIGLLLLFTENKTLDDELVRALVPVGEKLAVECSACLQNTELELVSDSTRNINQELSRSEAELRNNISQMKQAEAELVSNRVHLAMILQSLGEGIIVLDEKFKVLVMNVRAMEYLDHVPINGAEFSFSEMFEKCSTDLTEIKSFIFGSNDDAYLDIRITKGRQKDRSYRISRNRTPELPEEAPEIILMLRDITLELEAERLKNEFISNLSHELRTPMNAILGISKVILEKNSANLNDRQREGLSIISDSGNRLLSLINDILDLSKLEAGKMEITAEPFPLHDMIASIDVFMKALIGEKGLYFKYTIAPDAPAGIIGDRKRIGQIITNLLGNAVKFTDTGGISLVVKREKDFLYFICSDTGIGIDQKDIPYLFDRFRQVDGSLSRKYSGTGLGLSLSREFVKLMGGVISVESEVGVGTAVHFGIPLKETNVCGDAACAADIAEKKEGEERPRDISVLIVDDEDSARVTLAMILERDYRLMFAENGSDALELAKKNKPDIILMDIMMPVLDGIMTLKLLRSDPLCAGIPVVALTAHAFAGERERIMAEGFDYYLTKPVDEKALVSVIENYAGGKKKDDAGTVDNQTEESHVGI